MTEMLSRGEKLPVDFSESVYLLRWAGGSGAGGSDGAGGADDVDAHGQIHAADAGETGLLGMVGKAERGPAAMEAIRENRRGVSDGGGRRGVSGVEGDSRGAGGGVSRIWAWRRSTSLTVEDMPVTVAVDAKGTSVHQTGPGSGRRGFRRSLLGFRFWRKGVVSADSLICRRPCSGAGRSKLFAMEFRGRWNRVVACAAVISCAFVPASAQATRHRLASTAVYHKYVDPLLSEPDFGTEYSDDGAADSVRPFSGKVGDNPYARPSEPVLTIVGAMTAAFPALIDCLSDRRTTSVVFDGNNITKRMNVSVGYVCLDILMAEAKGRGLNDPEDGDGLGASMSPSFYFRP